MSANPVQNPLQKSAVGSGRRVSQPPTRHDFSKIKTAVRIPNLIEIQRDSYNRFLQMDLLPEEREPAGLQAVFRSVFPISDFRQTAELDFVEYHIGNWQCKCGRLEGLRYLRANCKSCAGSADLRGLPPYTASWRSGARRRQPRASGGTARRGGTGRRETANPAGHGSTGAGTSG